MGIYIGPKADFVTCDRNIYEDGLKQAIVDASKGGHIHLNQSAGKSAN